MEAIEMLKILDKIEELKSFITKSSPTTPDKEPLQSEEINELSKALAEAQCDIKLTLAYRNKNGSFAEFADLASLINSIRFPLAQKGISFSQSIVENQQGLFLYTTLRHVSGQWIRSIIKIISPQDSDIRKLVSHIAYLRRLTLASLVGTTGMDEDDDGELATQDQRDSFKKGVSIQEQVRNYSKHDKSGPVKTINQTELDELNIVLQDWPDVYKDIMKSFGLRSLGDLPADRYRYAHDQACAIIKHRKQLLERENI